MRLGCVGPCRMTDRLAAEVKEGAVYVCLRRAHAYEHVATSVRLKDLGGNVVVRRHSLSDIYSEPESSGKEEVERRLLSTFAGSHLKVVALGPSQMDGNKPRLITARALWKDQCLYEVDIIDYGAFSSYICQLYDSMLIFFFKNRHWLGTFKIDCFCSILKKKNNSIFYTRAPFDMYINLSVNVWLLTITSL